MGIFIKTEAHKQKKEKRSGTRGDTACDQFGWAEAQARKKICEMGKEGARKRRKRRKGELDAIGRHSVCTTGK